MLKMYSASRFQALAVFVFFCSSAAAVSADSQISINGSDFQTATTPITIVQEQPVNSVSIVEDGPHLDSAVLQLDSYNRTAIIQFGNDKIAILRQSGLYNRAMIVQVASTEHDIQTIDSSQGGYSESKNFLFTKQTAVNDSEPIAQRFRELTLDEAKTVAQNFIFAPELSRINVGLLDDISQHFTSLLTNRLDQTRFKTCLDETSVKSGSACLSRPFFATISYGHAERDSVLGALGYEQSIGSATLGADLQLSPFSRFGLAFNFAQSQSDINQGLGNVDVTSYQIGGFGSISKSQYYLDLIATLGKADFSSDRFGGTSSVRSDTNGWSYAGRLQGGYLFELDNVRLGPFLAARYSSGKVDSFWEKGSPLLTQGIEEQKRESFVASLGATFNRQDTLGGYPVRSFLKLEIERDFGIGGEDTVESRFSLMPDFVVITPLDDVAADTYGRVSGGIDFSINRHTQLSLAGTALIGAERNSQFNLYGTLSVAF